MKATVTRSTGSWYNIRDDEGNFLDARIKGKFRLDGIDSTNPIAVGDVVEYESEGENAMIKKIHPRKNYIIRKSNNLSKQTQIIASNLDQAILLVTVNYPKTTTGFIDRFLITAEAYRIPVILVFNKLDLYTEDDISLMTEMKSLYRSLGYECFKVSAKTGQNINFVKNILHNKTTLIAGHSGAGKSTLINFINPLIEQRTAEISDYSNKGKHTTTFAEMFEIYADSYIIDTPGIKDFGVVHIKKEEVKEYFVEFRKYAPLCKFNNCIHINEPKCAVLEAVEKGEIYPSRYYSYLSIYNGDDAHH